MRINLGWVFLVAFLVSAFVFIFVLPNFAAWTTVLIVGMSVVIFVIIANRHVHVR